jgi:hypothetical protein
LVRRRQIGEEHFSSRCLAISPLALLGCACHVLPALLPIPDHRDATRPPCRRATSHPRTMARPRPRAIPAATVLQGGEAVEGEAIAEPFRFKAAPVSAAIPERLSRVAWCSIPYPHPSPIPLPRVSACVPLIHTRWRNASLRKAPAGPIRHGSRGGCSSVCRVAAAATISRGVEQGETAGQRGTLQALRAVCTHPEASPQPFPSSGTGSALRGDTGGRRTPAHLHSLQPQRDSNPCRHLERVVS